MAITEKTRPIIIRDHDNLKQVIRLGSASDILAAFATNYDLGKRPLSLRIENSEITNYSEALGLLERTADSLFFQIDTVTNVSLGLIRENQQRPKILHQMGTKFKRWGSLGTGVKGPISSGLAGAKG